MFVFISFYNHRLFIKRTTVSWRSLNQCLHTRFLKKLVRGSTKNREIYFKNLKHRDISWYIFVLTSSYVRFYFVVLCLCPSRIIGGDKNVPRYQIFWPVNVFVSRGSSGSKNILVVLQGKKMWKTLIQTARNN